VRVRAGRRRPPAPARAAGRPGRKRSPGPAQRPAFCAGFGFIPWPVAAAG